MSKIYNVGDYVIIKADNESKIIGKIEEIIKESDEYIFRYNEYYFPEKTINGRQDYNSKYEVYKTDEIEKEFYSNIESKCEVTNFQHFIKRIQSIKDKKLVEKLFFFRQKYSVSDESFIPEYLPTSCFCNKIFNPDKNFIQCRDCKEYIHMECFLNAETQNCFKCSYNIESQLNNTNPNNSDYLGIKRNRTEDNEEKNKTMDNMEEKKIEEGKTNYQNLSEERRKYLVLLIEKLEKFNSATKDLCTEEKSRKIIRDKICYSLLYGIEEIRQTGDWKKMKVKEFQSNPNENTAIKICTNLSIAIESAIFITNGESNNKKYKDKFKTLYMNLMDYRNSEIRFSILNNDISPQELVKMSSEELAPSSLKNRRIERQNKYFKEQVLMKEDTKIIAKTHKGETLLTVDREDNQQDYYMGNEEIDKKDNISEKASFDYNSDNEERNIELKPLSKNNSVTINLSRNNSKPMKKDLKFKNLSSSMKDFYSNLEEFTVDNIIKKFNDKLKTLKTSTANEIIKLREIK